MAGTVIYGSLQLTPRGPCNVAENKNAGEKSIMNRDINFDNILPECLSLTNNSNLT